MNKKHRNLKNKCENQKDKPKREIIKKKEGEKMNAKIY